MCRGRGSSCWSCCCCPRVRSLQSWRNQVSISLHSLSPHPLSPLCCCVASVRNRNWSLNGTINNKSNNNYNNMSNRSATVAVWGRVVDFYGLSLISIVSLLMFLLLLILYAICGMLHCAKLLSRLVQTTQSSSVCFLCLAQIIHCPH